MKLLNVLSNIPNCLAKAAAVGVAIVGLSLPTMARSETDGLNAPLEVVRFGDDDTLRGFVGRYLHDPDLWPTVLALNNIATPADLQPGTDLKLPVQQVEAADSALVSSLLAIQEATAEGARIFAPLEIGSAIENRDAAIRQRIQGEWREVVNYSGRATDFAIQALGISISQRDRAAEAVVSDVQGDVEGRAPADPTWSNRSLNDVLVEFERLRTLSASTTQVTFRDLSRLRLNPNSNATIQRMRADPLTQRQVTKVSLVNGDFYALLNQLSEKSSFEIDVPGIESSTNSADFWIKSDDSGARFVNYDRQELEIDSNGEKIMLGKNQGIVVNETGTQRTEVLTSPRLSTPPLGAVIYTADAPLSWEPFDTAEAYWLEVATDPGFNQMALSEWGIRDTSFEAVNLTPARYHWRVAALDQLGLPGQWSSAQDFTIRLDNTPPFLTLLAPGPGMISTQPDLEVLGASETNATLTLNGDVIPVQSDGSFLAALTLVPGENLITVAATDPAGNQSTRSQTVVYRPAVEVSIVLSDNIPRIGDNLAARTDELSVFATTSADPGSVVVIQNEDGTEVAQGRVGIDGAIGFTVAVDDAPRGYSIAVLAPGGSIEGHIEFTAQRDSIPPVVKLDLPPPRATADDLVALSGDVGDAVQLELNGTLVPLVHGRFDLGITVQPGLNIFELVASDAVGNVSVVRVQTLLDIEPPEILDIQLGRAQGENGPIDLIVRVSDASGLRQAAPFVIAIDGQEVEGFLRCDSDSGLCRASLPPEPGALELIELIVEDYAGNEAFG